MLHLAKSFVLKLWLVLLLIIVLGALGISLGRLLLIPKISDYGTDVEQWASESLALSLPTRTFLPRLSEAHCSTSVP